MQWTQPLLKHEATEEQRELLMCPRSLHQWRPQPQDAGPSSQVSIPPTALCESLLTCPAHTLPCIQQTHFIYSCPSLRVKLYMPRIFFPHSTPATRIFNNDFLVRQTWEVSEQVQLAANFAEPAPPVLTEIHWTVTLWFAFLWASEQIEESN